MKHLFIIFTLANLFSVEVLASEDICITMLHQIVRATQTPEANARAFQLETLEIFKTAKAVALESQDLEIIKNYNKDIIRAAFTKFKQSWVRRYNPIVPFPRLYLLNADITMELLILDQEGISFSDLASEIGIVNNHHSGYFEIAAHIQTKFQFEGLFRAQKSIIFQDASVIFYTNVILNIANQEQLQKVCAGMKGYGIELNNYYKIVGYRPPQS